MIKDQKASLLINTENSVSRKRSLVFLFTGARSDFFVGFFIKHILGVTVENGRFGIGPAGVLFVSRCQYLFVPAHLRVDHTLLNASSIADRNSNMLIWDTYAVDAILMSRLLTSCSRGCYRKFYKRDA